MTALRWPQASYNGKAFDDTFATANSYYYRVGSDNIIKVSNPNPYAVYSAIGLMPDFGGSDNIINVTFANLAIPHIIQKLDRYHHHGKTDDGVQNLNFFLRRRLFPGASFPNPTLSFTGIRSISELGCPPVQQTSYITVSQTRRGREPSGPADDQGFQLDPPP